VKSFAEDGQTTKLYKIENSTKHLQFVIAIGEREALALSAASRHILDYKNGICREWPVSVISRRDPKFAGSLKRALSSSRQGVVERRGDFALIAEQVFMPIGAA